MTQNVPCETKAKKCSRCRRHAPKKGQRYCKECCAAYMRKWRPHALKKKIAKAVERMAEKMRRAA